MSPITPKGFQTIAQGRRSAAHPGWLNPKKRFPEPQRGSTKLHRGPWLHISGAGFHLSALVFRPG